MTGLLCYGIGLSAAALALSGDGNVQAAEEKTDSTGFDVSHMDKTCKPCDDFFQYVNGNWLKNNPIPPEYPIWGSGVIVVDNNRKQLREILEHAAANEAASWIERTEDRGLLRELHGYDVDRCSGSKVAGRGIRANRKAWR